MYKKHLGHVLPVSNMTPGRDELVSIQAAKLLTSAENDVESWSQMLMTSESANIALEWLTQERKLTKQTLSYAHVGWRSNPPGGGSGRNRGRTNTTNVPGWVTLPAFTDYDEFGRPLSDSTAMVKMRSVPPSERGFRRIDGGDSVLYFPHKPTELEPLLVVGGEIDALSVLQTGFNNVCAPTTGEGGWQGQYTGQLEGFDNIVILFDDDEAGRKGTEEAIEKLGWWRCSVAKWPKGINDANEGLQKLGNDWTHELIVNIIKDAESPAAARISRIGDRRQRLHDRRSDLASPGTTTGFTDLDTVVGGFRGSEMWFITGDTGSGKTTFASQLVLNQARLNKKCLVFPLEMGIDRQLFKWIRQNQEQDPAELTTQEFDLSITALDRMPIWIVDPLSGHLDPETLRNTMLFCHSRFGIEQVYIDHLNWMVIAGNKEREQLDQYMRVFAEVSQKTGMTVVVLVHPSAGQGQDRTDSRIIELSHIKGSSTIKQVADIVLSVYKPRDKTRSVEPDANGMFPAIVFSMKARSDYAIEGRVPFSFWPDAALFCEAPVTSTNKQ